MLDKAVEKVLSFYENGHLKLTGGIWGKVHALSVIIQYNFSDISLLHKNLLVELFVLLCVVLFRRFIQPK